jgi:carboxymethylenebutenolidase
LYFADRYSGHVNQFQRYLLDEFVQDYREGRMSRRDFVMKVIGITGGLAAAASLFSSVGLSQAEIAAAQAAPRVAQAGPNPVTISPDDPGITVSDVEFPTADGATVLGYQAMPAAPGNYAGIVVIHENRGLLPHFKDVVRRYAKAGFAAVAPDLLSRDGGTDGVDPDQAPGLLARADPQRHVEDAMAAGVFIQQQDGVRSDAHGLTGFCFGGGVTWRTIGNDLSVAASVAYYGPPPPLDQLAQTRAAALGIYAEQDTNITASVPSVMEALEAAGVWHEYKVYAGAQHAFFNDTGARYDKAASTDAWTRTVAWFREYLPPTE